jgi:hypothetical protein
MLLCRNHALCLFGIPVFLIALRLYFFNPSQYMSPHFLPCVFGFPLFFSCSSTWPFPPASATFPTETLAQMYPATLKHRLSNAVTHAQPAIHAVICVCGAVDEHQDYAIIYIDCAVIDNWTGPHAIRGRTSEYITARNICADTEEKDEHSIERRGRCRWHPGCVSICCRSDILHTQAETQKTEHSQSDRWTRNYNGGREQTSV